MSLTRFYWLAASLTITLLFIIVLALSPVQVQITLTPKASAVEAGLPTTTPVPPTAISPTQVPATPVPPTAVLPTPIPATPLPPTEVPRRSTATPEVPTATPVPTTDPHHPQLAILKSVSPSQVQVGERATFTLHVTNLGDAPATDVVITDEVPQQLEIVDLKSSKGDIIAQGQRVTAYPRTLDPGEEQRYTIVVRVREGTTDHEIGNLGVVTLGQPDDPGDNTSITTLLITPGKTAQTIPPSLPKTADPTAMHVWAQYWPLLVLAFGIFAFGVATRRGAFRAQSMQVLVGSAPCTLTATAEERADWEGHATGVTLDPHDLIQRWRAGSNTSELVVFVANCNPHADRLAVSIAVQRVLQSRLNQQGE